LILHIKKCICYTSFKFLNNILLYTIIFRKLNLNCEMCSLLSFYETHEDQVKVGLENYILGMIYFLVFGRAQVYIYSFLTRVIFKITTEEFCVQCTYWIAAALISPSL